MRYIRRSSRILWRCVGESGCRAPYGHGHGHASEQYMLTCHFVQEIARRQSRGDSPSMVRCLSLRLVQSLARWPEALPEHFQE